MSVSYIEVKQGGRRFFKNIHEQKNAHHHLRSKKACIFVAFAKRVCNNEISYVDQLKFLGNYLTKIVKNKVRFL